MLKASQTLICNENYLADILVVCVFKVHKYIYVMGSDKMDTNAESDQKLFDCHYRVNTA